MQSSGLPWKDGAGFSFFGFGGRTKQREPELKSPRQAAAAAAEKPSEGTQKIDKKPSQALESVTNAVGDTVSSGSSRPATSARRSTELSKNVWPHAAKWVIPAFHASPAHILLGYCMRLHFRACSAHALPLPLLTIPSCG